MSVPTTALLRTLALSLALVGAAVPASAQEPGEDPETPVAPAPPASPRPSPAPPAQATARPGQPAVPPQPAVAPGVVEEFVNHTSFKNRVFEVKNRNPERLVPVLRAMGSGYRGALVSASREFGTITVRDFPENIAAIAEALPRLDRPEPPRADVEFHLHILLASPTEGQGELPAELKNVVTQLRSTLTYKSFTLLGSVVQRAQEGGVVPIGGKGAVQADLPKGAGPRLVDLQYRFGMRSIAVSPDTQRVDMEDFDFQIYGDQNEAAVRSSLSLRGGEQVVVGTASFKNRGLILVLSAKTIR